MTDIGLLDNAAWFAMETLQSDLATSRGQARRYLPEVSPFAAMETGDGFSDLAGLVGSGETVALLSPRNNPASLPDSFQSLGEFAVVQMICDQPRMESVESPGALLVEDDEADMFALAKATDPGPFESRTRLMGNYYGVRAGGALVAMAGERLRLPGWTEVSGVCTSEQARGKGYARALVTQVMKDITARGELAFLHVRYGSPSEKSATRVYERLGFEPHQDMLVQVIQKI